MSGQRGLPSLPSMRNLLSSLLPQLSLPLSPIVEEQLPLLCSGLQHLGAALEKELPDQLDRLQGLMATLCADPSVDIQLRLQLLETLELRSLGWRRHPAMADYYSQRALAAKSQTESSLRASSQRQQMENSQQASSTMGGGSVLQQQIPPGAVMVDGSPVFLTCQDQEVLEVAKAVLREKFPQMEEKCGSQTGRGEARVRHSARFLDR